MPRHTTPHHTKQTHTYPVLPTPCRYILHFHRWCAELEQHAFSLDQQAEQLAEQLLLAKRGSGPRVQQQQAAGFKPQPHRQ